MSACTVYVSYTADVTAITGLIQPGLEVVWRDDCLYLDGERHTQVMNDEVTPTTTQSGQLIVARDHRGMQ